jgi:replicative DNA helicase
MLAHLLGDGCVSRDPIYYCSRDEANLEVVEKAGAEFGVTTNRTPGRGVTYVHFPMIGRQARGHTNPIYDWLRELGVMGSVAHTKRVPSAVQTFDRSDAAMFLKHLWATDGSVTTARSGRIRIYYATTSRRLAEDVQRLLWRLGIGGRLRATTPSTSGRHRQGWVVDVSGGEDQLTFLTFVGVHGERGERCLEALDALQGHVMNPNVDVIPAEVWDLVRPAMRERGITTRELARRLGMAYCGSTLYRSGLSRARMRRVADAVGDERLGDFAESDVRWDAIVSIQAERDAEAFETDLQRGRCLLANGVVSHE